MENPKKKIRKENRQNNIIVIVYVENFSQLLLFYY